MQEHREEIARAITLAMSWHPSEDGPSYGEVRDPVIAMLDRAFLAEREACAKLAEAPIKQSVVNQFVSHTFGDSEFMSIREIDRVLVLRAETIRARASSPAEDQGGRP